MKNDSTPAQITAPTEVFALPQLPGSWVVRHEGQLFIVPARQNGWAARTPYRGHDPVKMGQQPVEGYPLLYTGIPSSSKAIDKDVAATAAEIFG